MFCARSYGDLQLWTRYREQVNVEFRFYQRGLKYYLWNIGSDMPKQQDLTDRFELEYNADQHRRPRSRSRGYDRLPRRR